MSERFYMICLRETVGNNASFHRHNGSGYSTNVSKAHVYTLADAQSSWECGRDIDLPISAEAVDTLTVYHVDHQYIPYQNVIESGCSQYVAFVKGDWNGNDVYWLSDLLPTDDFSKARIFTQPDVNETNLVWLPFAVADEKKRLTFNINQLNRRTMIQAAGLRMPEWLKKQNRRKKNASGKVRWNCPHCGKISWQFNPYDFEGCADLTCEEWQR
ncbi:hypothetical protein [Atlantibacter hermannii]|uniref:hypothetical protein n=1 Tax=Atlantibacter hermannii TaxID=565 RepID=UPI00289B82BA|nr:hypothetical protein [Atlantibacter hermannii]